MIYNGVDLSPYFLIEQYAGIDATPPVKLTTFSPAIGPGEIVTLVKLPNRTITATGWILRDDQMEVVDKINGLTSALIPQKTYVDIVFDELDIPYTYKGIILKEAKITNQTHSAAKCVITLTALPYRYGAQQTVTGAEITGTYNGTAPTGGQLSFTVGAGVTSLNVSLVGTTGVIALASDDGLAGNWMIDFDKMTVYLDGALNNGAVDFANTTFDIFRLTSGQFEIAFSQNVTNATFVYTEAYL